MKPKPSQVYTRFTKYEAIQRISLKGYKPIAFREPKTGEFFLTTFGGVETCHRSYPENTLRIICIPLAKKFL